MELARKEQPVSGGKEDNNFTKPLNPQSWVEGQRNLVAEEIDKREGNP